MLDKLFANIKSKTVLSILMAAANFAPYLANVQMWSSDPEVNRAVTGIVMGIATIFGIYGRNVAQGPLK